MGRARRTRGPSSSRPTPPRPRRPEVEPGWTTTGRGRTRPTPAPPRRRDRRVTHPGPESGPDLGVGRGGRGRRWEPQPRRRTPGSHPAGRGNKWWGRGPRAGRVQQEVGIQRCLDHPTQGESWGLRGLSGDRGPLPRRERPVSQAPARALGAPNGTGVAAPLLYERLVDVLVAEGASHVGVAHSHPRRALSCPGGTLTPYPPCARPRGDPKVQPSPPGQRPEGPTSTPRPVSRSRHV